MATVYKIENQIGDIYIGSTNRDEIKTRRNEHKYAFKTGLKGSLYNSFKVHGFDNHLFTELAHTTNDSVRELEHFIIQEFNPSLNIVKHYNATAIGKIWVNNGVVETQICKTDKIPQGYKMGRKPNHKLGRKKLLTINT